MPKKVIHELAFEQSPLGLALISLSDWRFIDVNKRFCEFAHRERDQLVGEQWPVIAGIGDFDVIKARIEDYKREISAHSFYDLSSTIYFDDEKQQSFLLLTAQDITAHKVAELHAKSIAEQLETLLDIVPAGIWLAHDQHAERVSCNQVARDWIQISKDSSNFLSNYVHSEHLSWAGTGDANGKLLDASQLPILRAAGGECVNNFEGQLILKNGQKRNIFGSARPLFDEKGEPRGAVSAYIDITDRKRAEAREQLLAREVDHRARNILSIIQAMVQLSKAENVASFKSLIAGRIGSLARAHTLLSDSRWQGADFRSLIQEELKPFGFDDPKAEDPQRFSVIGPDIALTPAAAQSLALVVHELATNASKYGSLRDPNGKLRIDWGVVEDRPEIFNFSWWEHNGRAVAPPDKNGFGATVIRTSVEDQLHGQILYSWLDEGMKVEISCPIAEVTNTPPPTLPVEPLRYDLLQRLIRFYHF